MLTNKILLRCFQTLLFVCICTMALAQRPKESTTKAPEKFKAPVVKSFLGKYEGKAGITSVEEGRTLISMPLRILDDKNNEYKISSYQFVYKRIGITEDEATGKTSPETDIVGRQFDTTPLPELWQKIITESLRKGEEFYFFDIIYMDKKERRFFAPELKISFQ